MSSTRRTEMPARYISISASSTELSRRRYRSMIAVSKVWRRSFGTLRFTDLLRPRWSAVSAHSCRPGCPDEPGCARNGQRRRAGLPQHPAWHSASLHRATNQLAKMVPDTGFIDLDHLTHRLLVTHRLLLHCMKKPSILKVRKILYVIIAAQALAHQRGEAIHALAKVDR